MISPARHKKIRRILELLPVAVAASYRRLLDEEPDPQLLEGFLQYLREQWGPHKAFLFRLPLSEMASYLPPDEWGGHWHDPDAMEMVNATLSDLQKQQEFECIWTADGDGPYRARMLMHATYEDLSVETVGDGASRYFIGMDPATSTGRSSIVVLKEINEAQVALVHVTTRKGLPIGDQVKLAYRTLNAFWPCPRFVVDREGGGMPLLTVMAEPGDVFHSWGKLGPMRLVDEMPGFPWHPEDPLRPSYKIATLLNMNNPAVTVTNDQIIADLQRNRLVIAGACEDTSEQAEEVYADLQTLKSTLVKLVRVAVGDGLKYDLPNPGASNHIHDDWSAFTLAYWGYLQERAAPETVNTDNMFALGTFVDF